MTRVLPVALGYARVIRAAGHEPVGVLTIRDTENRYGTEFTLEQLLNGVPPELDLVVPSCRASIAPLLASLEPDLVVCTAFPWKIPAEALAVPALGWLNGHPALLPLHRGPIPVAWAIRNGDEEIGITIHRMDAELDTGPILVQRSVPIGEYVEPPEFWARIGPITMELLADALAKVAAGEQGTAQEGGEYETFFSDEDAWLDFTRPAGELHRLVWAWRYAIPRGGLRGALAEIDGETVRVLASSLHETEGGYRVECGDGELWLVRTEPAEDQATAGSAVASA